MSTSITRLPARVVAILVATLLAVGVALVAPAYAATKDRVAGANRYGTAAEIATATFPGGATEVVLATGQNFPDALAASGLAGALQAPVLLTLTDQLPQETIDALDTLGAQTVHIIGGPVAVSLAVEAELVALGYTTERHGGADRYETAADVATELAANATIAADTAVIATGLNFPDALAGGPLAYAGPHPILLVRDIVPQATEDALVDLGITDIVILGETEAVSDAVEQELAQITGDTDPERLGGATRVETATEVADFALLNFPGFDGTEVLIANGFQNLGVDALAGGPHGGEIGAPILLVQETSLPVATQQWLTDNSPDLVRALGGPAVINESVLDAAVAAAEGAGNQTFTVTPSDEATNEVSSSATTNEGARQYSVSGLDDSLTYDIALFAAGDVSVSSAGVVTFADANDDNLADLTVDSTGGVIEVVNGAAVGTPDNHVEVAPVNGTITFTIDSTTTDQVIPVVWQESDDDDALDLDADNAPTEPFGIGGRKNWIPVEAASGTYTVGVEQVSRDADYFVGDTGGTSDGPSADDATFQYDSNDNYQLNGVPITMAQFEGLLTGHFTAGPNGDVVGITYTQDTSLSSTFNVTTDNVPPASDAEASVSNTDGDAEANDVTITWTASAQPDAVYDVYRDDTDGGAIGVGDTLVGDNVSGTSFLAEDQPNGTYNYYVVAVGGTSGSQSTTAAETADVTVPPVADTTGPLAIDTIVTANSGLAGTFDTGDVFKVVFNEEIAAPTVGDTIRAQDGDGTVGDFVNGTTATFALNTSAETVNGVSRPANTVLTVTLTTAPAEVAAGSTAGLQIPPTITDQAGTTDAAGNSWSISATPQDLVIDQDANDNVADSTDTTAPTMTAAAGTDGGAGSDTVTLTYSEAVRCNGNDPGQFVYDPDGTITTDTTVAATAVNCDGTDTVVLTFPTGTFTAGAANDEIDYTQSATADNRVEDLSANDAVSPDTEAVTG